MKTKVLVLFLILGIFSFLLLLPGQVLAQTSPEKILNYQSTVVVNKDRSLLVEEQITVQANGDQIKHGIYRDFPTKYGNWLFGASVKGFKILEVTKDSQPEDYSTENLTNGVRIYIGNKDSIIPPGKYTYKIIYKTTEQVGVFSDHDELYWNVTGNGWSFPIDTSGAYIYLPGKIKPTEMTGYTGIQGSKNTVNDFNMKTENNRTIITARNSHLLSPYEGYTVVVTWPKGFIDELPWYTKYGITTTSITSILLVISIVGFYYYLWLLVGRDRNEYRPVVTQYSPPKNVSPAQIRFINDLGSFDSTLMSSTLMNMAVKGYVTIEKTGNDNYIIHKTDKSAADLQDEEKTLYEGMFSTIGKENLPEDLTFGKIMSSLTGQNETLDPNSFYIRKSNWRKVKKLNESLQSFFEGLRDTYVVSNRGYLLWSIIPFGLYWIANTATGLEYLGLIGYASIAISVITLIIFFFALPRRTAKGLALQDEIDGFKVFLKSQAHYVTGVKMDLPSKFSMYEKYLPFAIALGVDPQWSAQFKETFQQMQQTGMNTTPRWYIGTGSYSNFSSSSFSSSFSHTISSSSTDPTSHSGSGGGGSSGGGGGGGGGGGW